jgi:glycosyltransferase involved in cell wall biosynthesis
VTDKNAASIIAVSEQLPIVSVIVATFNSENFLRACLSNVTRQTIFNSCEIIVVDHASSENEMGVVKHFQEKYPNIIYYRSENPSTVYGAWNSGLKIARGAYWVNLNTDDGMRDDALEIMVSAMKKHSDCDLAYCDVAWTTKANDKFPSNNILKNVFYPEYTPAYTLFYCLTGCLQFWRTKSLRNLGGFDEKYCAAGDYEITARLMVSGMKAVHVAEILSLFYQNLNGLTQSSTRSGDEHVCVMRQYRKSLDIRKIFKIPNNSATVEANAFASLGKFACHFKVPWESKYQSHNDFAVYCFELALQRDPENRAVGQNLVALLHTLGCLNATESELIKRWPKMREWIHQFRLGQFEDLPLIEKQLVGPVYRHRVFPDKPTDDQISGEPEKFRPWINRIDGRHVYFSEGIYPIPNGLNYHLTELQSAGRFFANLLMDLPPFYAHFGGAGDALLLLASFYDQNPDGVVFCYPNNIESTRALFEAFPKLSKIYYLPQHSNPIFHAILRWVVYEVKNCRGAGATPRDDYAREWRSELDIEREYGITKTPAWALKMRKNESSKKVAVAPSGSQIGMVGSKRNIIPPEIWFDLIEHIISCGFEPIILGVKSETNDYPALCGCRDARSESFAEQVRLVGYCAGLVGADSWAKTLSALIGIPTLVFEPVKGEDLASWKDPSDWVFIEPWTNIKVVKSINEFKSQFNACITKVGMVQKSKTIRPIVVWEGGFFDCNSLDNINRELTDRLPDNFDLHRVVPKSIRSGIGVNQTRMDGGKNFSIDPPNHVDITVRHYWPPNWNRPHVGKLVVIQPWEFGILPKEWVRDASNVDVFWVPTDLVRRMYLESGIPAEKVHVVNNGVDTRKFRPGRKPLPLGTKKKFKFLFVGGTIFRKGADILLATYIQTFNAFDDVCLVIKDFGGDGCYQGQTIGESIRKIQNKPNSPEIIYIDQKLSVEQMASLYSACDSLVLPYRGEGFGLPVLEAMSSGLSVIVTAGGATDSFVPAEAGWKISSRKFGIGNHVGNIELVKDGWLLEPNPKDLSSIMRFVANHPLENKKRGEYGRSFAQQYYDWAIIAEQVARRLNEIAKL